ncbi:MAG TPA: TAT-variant-translocated molybdopterin oxidoreductase [Thermoanaerobaculia bacterium]|nr:TAT-variant-translocated molybdopterin oxidoreductase [Thermoanaerobaculia bacterium]
MSETRKLDFTSFRERIGDLRGREYWRSLEELSRSDAFDEFFQSEFPQQALPLAKGVDRRSFMKLMGASVAMAGLTACRPPGETIIPYVNQPENLIPGKPMYFATAMPLSGYARGVLVESHMFRPTKIEGNPEHPASLGASDAQMQASILGLYDPDRSQVVRHMGEISTWSEFIAALQPVLNQERAGAGGLRILTQTVTSPTLGAQIERLQAEYPGLGWHQWEPAGGDALREGARLAFGGFANVLYDFTRANVIVSLGSDFVEEGPAHLRYARDFASRRRVRQGERDAAMNRLYAIESSPTSTGSIADHRLPVKPSQIESMARAILAALGGGSAGEDTHAPEFIAAVAKDLLASRGASIVIAGDHQPPAVHAIAHGINQALGNIGSTVMVIDSPEVRPVNQLESLRQLVTDINAGAVRALIILGGNPVFDAPADFNFKAALQKVPFRAHLSLYNDETSLLSHWHIPETHYLESWGDARAYDGTATIMQPLIAPLYNGRSAYEVLGAMLGALNTSPYTAVRNHWFERGTTEETWRRALHDGLIAGSALPPRTVAASGAVPASGPAQAAGGIELEIRPDPTIFDGRFANNAWLQELPKPQTKITWDNVLLIGPGTADQIGFGVDERSALFNELKTRVVEVEYRGVKVHLPVWVVPGHAEGAATIYLGGGRENGGRIAGAGTNIYPLRPSTAMWGGAGARITLTSRAPYPIGCTQEHQSLDPKLVGERGIIRDATYQHYLGNPNFVQDYEHQIEQVAGLENSNESLYPPFAYKGHAWAMVIDTSVCTGCNGCVAACQSENNIAVVGKDEVVRERELHWLRIDRYYKGDPANPQVYHQPVPCMQCELAPCEPVCPVQATSHSEDGLNDMTYNRCVGTRYCSNNCPYKVRRFNFFGYSDYDTPALKAMRNPDVTIRTRGVMEKCTYCVQRINHGKIEAEKENRRVRDGEVVTACQQACPTQAIVFGDMNDPSSHVAQLKKEPTMYALLGELNTRPRTTYLATIRNPNPELVPAAATAAGEHH